MNKKYRHELKYYIGNDEYSLLSRKLVLTMDRDENASSHGKYFIRSLYFDDYKDSAMESKLDGVDHRDKYRIRIYNMKDNGIKLEKKHKEGPYICKQSIGLTRRESDEIINGQIHCLLKRKDADALSFYAAFRTLHLKPRVLVDYYREAYIFNQEDVRITFDTNLKTGFRSIDLFNPSIPTYPVLDEYGMIVEVKFNKYLPSYIRELIQPLNNAARSAISKYCLCRRYE